ncbi:hypothetical protein ACIPPJ_33320 [Streptomyces sp. NPDC086091]|uniref:hypothetical protein n=1 Tax=Streptomyces sp. NPDC086091 TaxID=3365751 RepID=UPI0038001E62
MGVDLGGGQLAESRPVLRSGGADAPAGAAASAGRREGCRTDDGDTRKPTAPPADTRWQEIAGFKVPSSAVAGPLLVSGPVWWCFAHTPMGAVMAAQVVQAAITGPEWRMVAEHQLVPNRGRNFLAAKLSREDPSSTGKSIYTFSGFSISKYSPEKATVEILLNSGTQGGMFSCEMSLSWVDGDWKVVPQVDGTLSSDVFKVDNAKDFVKWKV